MPQSAATSNRLARIAMQFYQPIYPPPDPPPRRVPTPTVGRCAYCAGSAAPDAAGRCPSCGAPKQAAGPFIPQYVQEIIY